jgi:hypothetical protein
MVRRQAPVFMNVQIIVSQLPSGISLLFVHRVWLPEFVSGRHVCMYMHVSLNACECVVR